MIDREIEQRFRRLEGRFPQNSITSVSERHVHAGGDVLAAAATANLTLTTSAQSIVGNGDSTKVRLLLDIGTWFIEGIFHFEHSVAGASYAYGSLFVNDSGTAESGLAILHQTAVQATVPQTWRVVITADNTPVELKAHKGAAGGTALCNGTDTTLSAVRATRGHKGVSGSGGVTSHGALTGLSNDDHTQ